MKSLLKKLSVRHKNNKFLYYLVNFSRQIIPASFYRISLKGKLDSLKQYDADYIKKRVDYYNKIQDKVELTDKGIQLSDFKLGKKHKTYFFDTFEYTRYFNPSFKASFCFGDIIHVPEIPSIVKSRPIEADNSNSVLMKLNKVRHFIYVKDKTAFQNKKDMLVFRANVYQPNRMRFLEMYFNHPKCNVGQVNKGKNPQWLVEKMTITEQLKYKFILCLEGNDVASNLKWVMSSNSLAVMPKPKYETWFMEGALIPDHHYVCIKDDYSDLPEKLDFYIKNTDAALQIIHNAHRHVEQFKDNEREDLISLLVLQKYFVKTGQSNK